MSMYYEGFSEARKRVFNMDEAEMLSYIDDLFGRDNLREGYTLDELRAETLLQVEREWTDTSSKEYETVSFYTDLYNAMKEATK